MKKVAWLVLVLVVVVGVGVFIYRGRCDGKPDVIEFPYQVVMAPQNLLIVDGYELRGRVVFTWEEGDSLRVNGIPILPSRRSPFGPTDEELEARARAFLMRIPFARALFDSGKTVSEVRDIYNTRLGNWIDRSIEVYWRVFLATGSPDSGVAAVRREMDTVLVDPERTEVSSRGMKVWFKEEGQRAPLLVQFGERPPREFRPREEASKITYEKVADDVRSLRMDLKIPETQVLVVDASYRVMGGHTVDEAVAQIEAGKEGRYIEGPLDKKQVRWVLLRRGVKVDELR